MGYPQLLKSLSKSAPSHPQGILTRWFVMEKKKFPIFSSPSQTSG
jgi:hypothetical protein